MSYFAAFAIIALSAILAGVAARRLQRRVELELRQRHHDVGSVIFLQLGVVFGVLLAFIFSEAWTEYNAAGQAINAEIGALHGAGMIAAAMPKESAEAILAAERAYVGDVVAHEWPYLTAHRSGRPETGRAFENMVWTAANAPAPDAVTQSKKDQVLSQFMQAHLQRESRLFQAGNGIPAALWIILIGFTFLLTLFVSLAAIQSLGAAVAFAASFAGGVASILVMARLFDYPFEGALALSPHLFLELDDKLAGLLALARNGFR